MTRMLWMSGEGRISHLGFVSWEVQGAGDVFRGGRGSFGCAYRKWTSLMPISREIICLLISSITRNALYIVNTQSSSNIDYLGTLQE